MPSYRGKPAPQTTYLDRQVLTLHLDIHVDSTERLVADLRVAYTECTQSSTRADQFQYLFSRAGEKLQHLSNKLEREKKVNKKLFTDLEECRKDWTRRYNDLDSRYRRLQKQKQPALGQGVWCPGCVAQHAASYEQARGHRRHSHHHFHNPYPPMASGAIPVPPREPTPPIETLQAPVDTQRIRELRENIRQQRDLLFDGDAEAQRLSARFNKLPGQNPPNRVRNLYPNDIGVVRIGRYD
jgi:DNA repair exonuclease SbcCD ATPase subunit